MRVMKVTCPECGEKAVISKVTPRDRLATDIYCACTNVECGHTYVVNLTFSHSLSPSQKQGEASLSGIT